MKGRERFLSEFSKAVSDGAAAVFVGAGVSAGAGYPSWRELLEDIGEELGVKSNDVQDLAALAQWGIRKANSRTPVLTVIRERVGVDLDIPVPLEVLARLPIRNIWTTNYDRLIERAFGAIGRPIDVVSSDRDLAIRARPGAARLFKMHGSVERLDDLVISTDDYELYRKSRGSFRPLLQAHMSSYSMLFIGLSFTDPNLRHVLSLIRESFDTAPPEHYAIVKPPQQEDFGGEDEFKARHAQHRLWAEDLLRYGLRVVEIESYSEVPDLMLALERRIARGRVWVSGSWPLDDTRTTAVIEFCAMLGRGLGEAGSTLVTGSGVAVAAATVDGFMGALRGYGGWSLDQRLIARPFAQPPKGAKPSKKAWSTLRGELARLAGAIIFVGGAKFEQGALALADGVAEERRLAEAAGAFLLPVGAFGGQAEVIAQELIGSPLRSEGASLQRPTDAELRTLLSEPGESLVKAVLRVLKRYQKVTT